MSHLLYIHGFLSSPQSLKAVQTHDWLSQHRPDITWHCPFLAPYPAQTQNTLEEIVEQYKTEQLALIGSSLGGFWSTWLVEKYDVKAVLINPAVQPSMLKSDYLNMELKNYHTEDSYILTEQHADELMMANIAHIKRYNNYWVLLQTGDETLDYRLAEEKYQGCKQSVEQGGDHSFQDYDKHISEIIKFLQL